MQINDLEALVAVVLAGSLVMERLVAIVKTIEPDWFGEPGPDPDAIYRVRDVALTSFVDPGSDWFATMGQRVDGRRWPRLSKLLRWAESTRFRLRLPPARWRRIRVLGVVMLTSVAAALALSGPDSCHWYDACRVVTYSDQAIHWAVFALLISGGSAFWAQVVGVVGATKDQLAAQNQAQPPRVVVVDKGDEPRFERSA